MPLALNDIKILICAILVSICTANAWSFAPRPDVNVDHQSPIKLAANQLLWMPESAVVSAEQVFHSESFSWRKLPRNSIHLGSQPQAVWLRFSLHNATDNAISRLLEIRWRNQSELDLYVRDKATGDVTHYPAGLVTDPQRLYEFNSSYVFPLELRANQDIEVALRVKSRLYVFLPTFIWQKDDFRAHQQTHFAWYSFAFGILAAMLAYNFSLFVFTRETNYAIYSVYAVSVIFYQLSITGIGDWLVWGASDWMRLNSLGISSNLSFLVATLFIRNFLGVKDIGGIWLRINDFLLFYWGVNLVLYLIWPAASQAVIETSSIMSLLSCIAGLALGVVLWVRGDISARYFTLAWGGLIIFTFVTVLMMVGVLPLNAFTENGQMIGFVAEMVLLSIALADRINRQKIEKDQAQQQALDSQNRMIEERETRLQVQNDYLKAQQKLNEQLEVRVAERTSELEVALKQVEDVNQYLEKLSVTDPLTNVSNRRYFDEALSHELEHSAKTGKPTSLILIDIDHFKRLNDEFGHLVGDDCLKVVASTLNSIKMRESDMVARYGGEEFAIILPNTSETEAVQVAERLRTAIEDLEFILEGSRVRISASLGVAGTDAGVEAPPELIIQLADEALYRAKAGGRNRTVSAQSIL